MKKIKNNYTNFILTVIAVALIGILFKGEINKPTHAATIDYGVEKGEIITTCVLDRVFVLYKSSIAQVWTYSSQRGSKPKHCDDI